MRQLKVVHVANIDVGLKVHLGNYMRYQRARGYDVSAITHPGAWIRKDTIILDGIYVKIIPFRPQISPIADLRTLSQLLLYFRQQRFDIVHTHTVKPGLLGRVAAKMAGTPVILHTVHGFYFYDGMPDSQRRFFVGIEKVGAACGDLLLSQNRQDMESAVELGICGQDGIAYLGNGIDLSRFDPQRVTGAHLAALRQSLGLDDQTPIIGYAARLEREKGIGEFLEAAASLKSRGTKATFLVIGSYQPQKKASIDPEVAVREYGLEREVKLLGYRDDIPELIRLMDVVVLPSYGREGVPRILMESAALGKPVVATRVRGVLEAVDDGVTGLLVPPRDGEALADAIEALIREPSRASTMGGMARQKALAEFDERNFFYRSDMIYRRLLRAKLGETAVECLEPVPKIEVEF